MARRSFVPASGAASRARASAAQATRGSGGAAPFGVRLKRAWNELLGYPAAPDVYKGAQGGRLTADWNPMLLSADQEQRWSLPRLRARARELTRNNAYAGMYLNLLAVNVSGPHGVTYQARIRDNSNQLNERLNETIEDAWDEWSEAPTLDGRFSRVEFEHQLLEGTGRDGEQFVRIWRGADLNKFGIALEPLDPDLLDERFNRLPGEDGNEIRLGVEVDSKARPLAYWFWDRPLSDMSSGQPRQRTRIPADEIIHLGRANRVNQTRFLTWFAPVMLPMHMLGGYTEAELVAARTAAAKMGFFVKQADGSGAVPPTADSNGDIVMDAAPGTFDFAPDGYTVEPWSPDHPSTAFPAFVKAMLREVATGLRVSYNSLANDLESVNYSSIRAGMLAERDVWRTLQQWWIGAFYKRVFREWLNMALLTGALKLDTRDPRKFLKGVWTPRGWSHVDPLKDIQASVLAMQAGLASRQSVLAETGDDYEEIFEQLRDEKELEEQFGIDVSIPADAAAKGGDKITQADEVDGTDGKSADDGSGSSDSGKKKSKSKNGSGARESVLAALAGAQPGRNGHGED